MTVNTPDWYQQMERSSNIRRAASSGTGTVVHQDGIIFYYEPGDGWYKINAQGQITKASQPPRGWNSNGEQVGTGSDPAPSPSPSPSPTPTPTPTPGS